MQYLHITINCAIFQSCSFDDDLLCVDSLEMFRKIDIQLMATTSAIDEFLNTDLQAVQNMNEKTPSKPKIAIAKSFNDKPGAARCLFPASDDPSTSSVANTSISSNGNSSPKKAKSSSPKTSYKLTEIYKRLFECEPEAAHNAEIDAMILLRCAVANKTEFAKAADEMAVNFKDAPFK